jgi:hypothetical protein
VPLAHCRFLFHTRFYLVAERESANWVRNIQSQPQVKVRVGEAEFNAVRASCTMTANLTSRPP